VFVKGVVLGELMLFVEKRNRQESVFDFIFLKSRKEENILFLRA